MWAPLHLHLSSNVRKIQLLRLNEVPLITGTLKGLFRQKKNWGPLRDDICLPSIKLFCQEPHFSFGEQRGWLPQWSWGTQRGRKKDGERRRIKGGFIERLTGKQARQARRWKCERKLQKRKTEGKNGANRVFEGFETFPMLTLWCLVSHTHTHWPRFGALYKIFCLLPQSCKITPLHCAHPQHSQPCTNINKQTHTPTHTHRPPKSDIRQIGECVVSLLSFI